MRSAKLDPLPDRSQPAAPLRGRWTLPDNLPIRTAHKALAPEQDAIFAGWFPSGIENLLQPDAIRRDEATVGNRMAAAESIPSFHAVRCRRFHARWVQSIAAG